MKKILSMALMGTLILSLAACGNKAAEPAAAEPTATEAAVPETAEPEAAEPEAAEPEATEAAADASPEMQAMLDEYNAMVDRFNADVDEINADETLSSLDIVVDGVNQVSDAINMVTEAINGGSETDEAGMKEFITQTEVFLDELEALMVTYAGQTAITIPVTIVNNSGVDIYEMSMSPANDENWGTNIITEGSLADGTEGTTSMTVTAETLVWDILIADEEGSTVTFTGLDFSDADETAGAVVTLSTQDGEFFAEITPAQ